MQTYLVEGIEFYFERDSRKTKGGKGISCLPDTLEARFTKGIYSSAVLSVRKCFRLLHPILLEGVRKKEEGGKLEELDTKSTQRKTKERRPEM